MAELGSQPYQHATEPRAVRQRKKYREPLSDKNGVAVPRNIMFDRRVVRGSTYAQPISAQAQETTSKTKSSRPVKTEPQPVTEVAPVDGRKHIDVQTESYLEELS